MYVHSHYFSNKYYFIILLVVKPYKKSVRACARARDKLGIKKQLSLLLILTQHIVKEMKHKIVSIIHT